MARCFVPIAVGAILAGLAVGEGVVADDWPQFRKDGGRTGTSNDVTRFPVTDVWSWSTRGASGDTPTIEAAVVAGRIYFSALEVKTRYLVCADARTGSPIWRQPLVSPILPSRGIPAVSNSGKVFTYDVLAGKLPPSELNRQNGVLGGPLAAAPEEVGGFAIRVYDAVTGSNLANLPVELLQLEEDLAEVVLQHPGEEGNPVRNSDRPVNEIGPLGAPLLVGEELQAFNNLDIYFRWTPGGKVSATRIHHPGGPWPGEFWGFPPVITNGGVLVANDQTSARYCAVLGGARFQQWHQELQNTFGLAAAEGDSIYVGMGALGATRALVCLDSASGRPRWTYAPSGLAPSKTQGGYQKVAAYQRLAVPVRGGKGSSSGGVRMIRRPVVTRINRSESAYPPGHESSGGVALAEKRVFAEVDGAIVSLDRGTGRPLWRQSLPGQGYVQSLVASRRHLLACITVPVKQTARTATRNHPERREGRQRFMEQIPYWDPGIRKAGSRHFVVAFRAEDGKQVWEQELLQPGAFTLSGGLIFFANGDLTAYGPAERTYLVAEDGDDPQAYVTPRETEKEPQETPTDLPVAAAPTDTERPASPASGERESKSLPAEARADVSILRLTYDTPLEAQLAQVRDRVKLLEPQRIPLILQLDWLDPLRAAVRGLAPDTLAPPPAEFVARCARLAQAGTPLYFDLAPEVNLYLRRYPERTRAVTELLAPAAAAVRRASPGCQIVFTFNTEVLLETYGKGMVYPYGKLPKGDPQTEPALLTGLARLADAVGLSSRPYAGFRNAGVLPPDYLLRARKLFAPQPLLVTRIVIDADVRGAVVRGERAEFARRMLQACYWLNARVVAQAELTGYPELAVGEDGGAKDPIRQMAVKWQGVVAWPRVARLTATPPRHLPEALDPEGPRDTGQ